MNWSDDTLMAFADGELDPPQRAEVERALAADATLRERVARMTRQRDRVAAAYAPALDEPVPERLEKLLRESVAVPVAGLSRARAARERRRALPGWAQWGGMAASVVLGVVLGTRLERPAVDPALGLNEGRIVATGPFGQALSSQLASVPVAGAAVAVQLSFVDKSGRYCRSFSTASAAGLACREGGEWAVQAVAAATAAPDGAVRQAASALPREVLDAVDQRIMGGTLDADQERRARDQGWQR